VPPARILERDYNADIGGLSPVAPAVPTSRPAVEAVPPPPGLANSGFGNVTPKTYRVRGPAGESLQEIARRTLGDGNQAARVRGFNPTLSPDVRLPIPPGTVLRLPAEARVDAADKP
jgi:nucleoid-associated protein YgaU